MGRFEVLSKEETIMLARTIRAGKTEGGYNAAALRAIDRMVNHNLRWVVSVWAKNYQEYIGPNSDRLADLLQEGTIGLRRAAERFDPGLGYAFATYSQWWIKKHMQEYIFVDARIIRVPSDAQGLYSKYKKLRTSKDHEQSISELAKITCNSSASVDQRVRAVSEAICNTKPSHLLDRAALDNEEQEPQEHWDTLFDLVASRAELDPEDRELLLGKYAGMSFGAMQAMWPDITHIQKRYQSARLRFVRSARELASEENVKGAFLASTFSVA